MEDTNDALISKIRAMEPDSATHKPRPSRSMNELRKMIEQQDRNMHETGQHVNRFKSTQYNVLRAANREIDAASLRTGRIGQNGLHRYDVQPKGEKAQHNLRDYYLKELKDKKGTTDFTEGPLFIVKGLHNYSNLPAGDLRVMRSSTSIHEQFINPVDRAQIPSKYDHLQGSELTDNDGSLGSISVKRPSTTGAETTFMMQTSGGLRSGHLTGTQRSRPQSGAQRNGSSRVPSGGVGFEDEGASTGYRVDSDDTGIGSLELEEKAVHRRTRFYRNAIEQATRRNPSALDNLEVTLRDKLSQYAAGTRGNSLKSAFRFFDRGARGAIDLSSFEKALVSMGFSMDKNVMVAMFARYDVARKGSINYVNFTQRVMEPSFIGPCSSDSMSPQATGQWVQLRSLLAYFKANGGSFQGLEAPWRSCRTPEEIHYMSDEDFMDRLRLRSVFHSLAKHGGSGGSTSSSVGNSSVSSGSDTGGQEKGSLEVREFQRMLKLVGLVANPFEGQEMFKHIDAKKCGHISFDDFYEFYTSMPPSMPYSSNQAEEKDCFE